MATIHKEILIDVTPEQVWDVIRDVGEVHRRLLPDRVVATQLAEDSRILTFPDGGTAREAIIAIDDEMRRLAYAVVAGRMPLTHHHASFQVFAAGQRRARLVWITDILPHTFAEVVRQHVERGISEMKQAIESDAKGDVAAHP